MNAAQIELNRRYEKVCQFENEGVNGRPFGWGSYEQQTLKDYSDYFWIEGYKTIDEKIREKVGKARVLDLAGPAIFVDNQVEVLIQIGD